MTELKERIHKNGIDYVLVIEQMKEAEGVTEDLKRRDQMGWVGAMNNIRSRAEEIILTEIVYQ